MASLVSRAVLRRCQRDQFADRWHAVGRVECRDLARRATGLSMSDITQMLADIESGDAAASARLLPLVYDELRRLAARKLRHEKPGQTLQATALVHEVYLRLIDQTTPQRWDNQRHFFAAAAEAMRRILVERARQKRSLKRGGNLQRVAMDAAEPEVMPMACDDLLGLDDALTRLQQKDPRKAQLVKLRFFAGLTTAQAARSLGVSLTTAQNDWAYARSWLKLEMSGGRQPDTTANRE